MSIPIIRQLAELEPWIVERRLRSALILTGPSRRFLQELREVLGDLEIEVFDGAVVHVPESVVEAAAEVIEQTSPELLISLGGGAATGLAKALRLEHEIPFVAVPTTYSASELTSFYGVSAGREKRTGRDPRVRPDLVVHDVRLTLDMPLPLSAASLINALAHPISAMSAGADPGPSRRAIAAVTDALLAVLASPRSPRARRAAFAGVAAAGAIIEGGELGLHHRIAHLLGGRFAAPHAGLHSVLLPHFVASLEPELAAEVDGAAAVADLPGMLHDALARSGAPVSLRELEVDGGELAALIEANQAPRWVRAAYLGLRPSRRVRVIAEDLWAGGAPLEDADRAVVALHGRGSTATAAIEQVRAAIGDAPGVAICAPQAPSGSWYDARYTECSDEILAAPLAAADAAIDRAVAAVGADQVFVHGFSQGACLAIEAIARRGEPLAGLIALSGARPGAGAAPRNVAGLPVLLASSDDDPWIARGDVDATAALLSAAGARVTRLRAPGDSHEIRGRERLATRSMILGWSTGDGPRGFGNSHEVELLQGALPRDQNSPRHVAYGLWAEQINGTGFVAPRHENQRAWLYRIRPATQHRELARIDHPRVTGRFDDLPVDPNLIGFTPAAIPDGPIDFVDGLTTLGGAGRADLRRGYAVHVYAANRSMEHRAFANADGDLLIVPQLGELTLVTELGVLEVGPGAIAVLPRGFKFSVLIDGAARGWVAEVFGRHFELPDRGPVGANGLTDPRHFTAPSPWCEDRLDPGYAITTKIAGAMWQATQDWSPHDVIAWHGNYCPLRYDLSMFSPVGNTRVDHGDPSIYTVLSAPLDERGAASIDFVFFPPRWDPTEHTFRPPFFHRNATAEINGVIADPGLGPDSPFEPGCTFITQPLTAHGVLGRGVEAALAASDEQADRPRRTSARAMWFQLESALPMALTPWAAEGPERIDQWRGEWGAHRTHYDPRRR